MVWDTLLPLPGSEELRVISKSYFFLFPCSKSAEKSTADLKGKATYLHLLQSMDEECAGQRGVCPGRVNSPNYFLHCIFKMSLEESFLVALGCFSVQSGHICPWSMSFVTGM